MKYPLTTVTACGRRLPGRRCRRLLAAATALVVGGSACAGDAVDPRAVGADPGRTTETRYDWSAADGEVPRLTDVTVEWGLDGFENSADVQAAGGVALGDLDADG